MFSCFRKKKKNNKNKNIRTNKEDYQVIKELHSTHNKKIYIVTQDNKKYIMKVFKEITKNNSEIFSVLYGYYHPNIQGFYKVYQKNGFYYTIHEYVDGDDLSNCLDNGRRFTEKEIYSIFVQLVDGLDYLHNFGIIHCDLKLENIIIDEYNRIKIIDFDLAIFIGHSDKYNSTSVFGSYHYVAPESVTCYEYSEKSDIWQLGVILFILITDRYPCNLEHGCSYNCYKTMKEDLKTYIDAKKFDASLYKLVKNMLKIYPGERYTLDDIMKSKWIKNNLKVYE